MLSSCYEEGELLDAPYFVDVKLLLYNLLLNKTVLFFQGSVELMHIKTFLGTEGWCAIDISTCTAYRSKSLLTLSQTRLNVNLTTHAVSRARAIMALYQAMIADSPALSK